MRALVLLFPLLEPAAHLLHRTSIICVTYLLPAPKPYTSLTPRPHSMDQFITLFPETPAGAATEILETVIPLDEDSPYRPPTWCTIS
ncbi:hypothetical protein FPV67DRAFT_1502876 [Lyophyllum atratum]|nr:hypothetical protein FPV67DRAFT_1502876 [Lyophyllum atratum]